LGLRGLAVDAPRGRPGPAEPLARVVASPATAVVGDPPQPGDVTQIVAMVADEPLRVPDVRHPEDARDGRALRALRLALGGRVHAVLARRNVSAQGSGIAARRASRRASSA